MVQSQPQAPGNTASGWLGRTARLLLSPPSSWILLFYAALVLVSSWAYTSERIAADREQSLQAERSRLNDVVVALGTATVAMINDGVGAAVAGANELDSSRPTGKSTDATTAATLEKMLTGGQYVRSLFIAQPGHFVRAGRGGVHESSHATPGWLAGLPTETSTDTWVGIPMPDPDSATRSVVPIAQRIGPAGPAAAWSGALFDFSASDALGRWVGHSASTAGLIATSGDVVAIAPAARTDRLRIGLNVGTSPLFKAGSQGPATGIVQGYAPRFGTLMVFAYERIPDYPVNVFVGDPMESILAPWRDRRQTTLQAAGAACAFLVLVTVLLMRNLNSRRRRRMAASAQLARQQDQSAVLLRLAKAGAPSQAALFDVLERVCRDASTVLSSEHVSMWLVDTQEQVLRCNGHAPPGRIPADHAPVPLARISASLETLRSERVLDRAHTTPAAGLDQLARNTLQGREPKSLVAAAVRGSGDLIGVLIAAHFSTGRAWQHDELAFLGGLADQAAHALGAFEREQILEDLRTVTGELLRSQDEERRRVGRELHDATGQTLSALELDLARLLPYVDSLGPDRRNLLENCARLAKQCSAEIRTASYLLHPPLLDELGIASALRWLADGLRERTGMQVHLDLPDAMVRMPREAELSLFRVAQEALTNVQRHSGSPSVSLRLQVAPDVVQLDIQDSGRGAAAAARQRSGEAKQKPGVGLAGMRERVRQMGGTFLFDSRTSGTHIKVTLPIPPMPDQARI